MKKFIASLVAMSLVGLISLGCSDAPSPDSNVLETITKATYEPASLCGKCGHIKGTDACCAEGAETCAKCQLAKGAPGCCKMESGTDVALCTKCGHMKGNDACCAEGAEACAKCQLAKGSPGCCKLTVAAEETDGPEADAEDHGEDHEGHDAEQKDAAA